MAADDEAIVRRVIDEAINRHDPSALDRLVADDGVKARWLAKFEAFPDVELVVGTILAGDGEVWTRGVFRATHAGDWPPYEATGRRVEMDYMDRWVVRDGRIVGNEGFWDGVQLLPDGMRQRAGLSRPSSRCDQGAFGVPRGESAWRV